ncbi:MAG: AbrB/MazE/SpoVT family DNA-binding domain-containing protein [Gemmatimonadetes bacterium]|nr:AbrB/MazE/SpoVT family DNA-binding domain-containing protein [Gemmatimonadota bacterium]
MLMKVHPKGQVVIPAEIRRRLGIDVGDVLEVNVIPEDGKIELRRPRQAKARWMAGSLKQYARGKKFPSERRIAEALGSGLAGGG